MVTESLARRACPAKSGNNKNGELAEPTMPSGTDGDSLFRE